MLTRILFSIVAIVLLALPATAQNIEGSWQGSLRLPDASQLRLVFEFRKTTGLMDSPDQGAIDIPVGAVKSDGKVLSFDVPSINGTYRGTWDGKQWTGEWSQSTTRLPLNLSRLSGPAAPRGSAAKLKGDWDGTLEAGAQRLRLVFRIRVTNTGTFTSLDSIDQGATGIPINSILLQGSKVQVEMRSIGATFDGALDAKGQSIAGNWMQGGASLPITFTLREKGATGPELMRPQLPKPPLPYREESVAYDNGKAKVRLAGTLTLPKGPGPFPAVLLIAGSGPLDRDETLFGHKPFLVLADHLTRQGFAVLRVDKRGIGQSTGDYIAATSADFASDVEAGVAFLKSRKDINVRKIGLIGHSEGGIIAPLVASRDPSLAYLVLLAGPGVRGIEIAVMQATDSIRGANWPEKRINQFSALMQKVYEAIAKARNGTEAAARAREILKAAASIHGLSDDELNGLIAASTSNWFRYFVAYDPIPALRKTRSPVLALNGSLDVQVRTAPNFDGLRKGLSGNKDVEIRELPGLNHLFQNAKTGQVMEYSMIEETFAPSALQLIAKWLSARAR